MRLRLALACLLALTAGCDLAPVGPLPAGAPAKRDARVSLIQRVRAALVGDHLITVVTSNDLRAREFLVLGPNTSGPLPVGGEQQVALATGTHYLAFGNQGVSFAFVVDDDGKLRAVDQVAGVSGWGSDHLIVTGTPVTISVLPSVASKGMYIHGIFGDAAWRDAPGDFTFNLTPGGYYLQFGNQSVSFPFTVDKAGKVQTTEPVAGVSGWDTNHLVVTGTPVTISVADSVAAKAVYIHGIQGDYQWRTTPGDFTFNLTPGGYYLQFGNQSVSFPFTVDKAGKVQTTEPVAGVSGWDTNHLVVTGTPVTISVAELTSTGVYIHGIEGDARWRATPGDFALNLTPGTYAVQFGNIGVSFFFAVDRSGKLSSSTTIAGTAGWGSSRLEIRGTPVLIDATTFEAPNVLIHGIEGVYAWRPTSGPIALKLAPGKYTVQFDKPAVQFTVELNFQGQFVTSGLPSNVTVTNGTTLTIAGSKAAPPPTDPPPMTGPCAGATTEAACDDGDACTSNDRCQDDGANGRRCRGDAVICDDAASCRRQRCVDGQCMPSDPKPAGTACNDGRWCTDDEACDGNGACSSPSANSPRCRLMPPARACRDGQPLGG